MNILEEYKIKAFEKKVINWCRENKTTLYASYDDYFRTDTVKEYIEKYENGAENELCYMLEENWIEARGQEECELWEKCKDKLNIPYDLEEHLEKIFFDFVEVNIDYDHYFERDYYFTIYLKTDKNTLKNLANLQGYILEKLPYLKQELVDFINDANIQYDFDGEEKLYDNEQDFYKKNKENIICIPVTMSLKQFFDWQLGLKVIGIHSGSFIGFFDEYGEGAYVSDFKFKTIHSFYLPNDMIDKIEINKKREGLRDYVILEKFKNVK